MLDEQSVLANAPTPMQDLSQSAIERAARQHARWSLEIPYGPVQ